MQPSRFANREPMLLAGVRQRHDITTAPRSIAEQWRRFGARPLGTESATRFGVMCGADATGFEYMCAVEVESFDGLPEGTGRMRVPAQHYAVFTHDRTAGALGAAWSAILEWLASGDFESAHKPDFEIYPPGVSPLDNARSIEIWVGVVPRAR